MSTYLTESDRCDCTCHKMPGVMHFMACCSVCKWCGEPIVFSAVEKHKRACRRPFEKKRWKKS